MGGAVPPLGRLTREEQVMDLFLCHTGADKEWVRMLGSRLEEHRVGLRSIEVFFDEWDIDYGANIISKIDAGLKQSRYVGLVLSPAMVKADWPTAEWQSQVMSDPAGKRGKVLPLLRHKFDPESGEPIDMPFVLAPLKRFDFTRDQDFERELSRLVRKLSDLPPARGAKRGTLGGSIQTAVSGQEAADHLDEVLPSNLLPVTQAPGFLYSDETSASTKREVWATVKGRSVPPFVLMKNRLVSFVPPNASERPFGNVLLGSSPRAEAMSSWMADADLRRQLVGLLNGGLREHCYHLGVFTPKKDRTQFYCPIFQDGRPREFRWGSGDGASGRARALAKMKTRSDGSQFGVHMSAYMRFIAIGERLFLLLEPGWLFTTDGITPLEGKEVGRFSTLWGGKERNAAVLRNVLMWGLLIAEGAREIVLNLATPSAPAQLRVQSVPVHTRISVGVAGDSIRLDRILGGVGAGEVRDRTAIEGIDDDRELDDVADRAILGALVPDNVTRSQAEAHDQNNAEEGDDSDEDAEEEPQLPF